jgi:hydroxymethylglutaryl-CoA lyase
MKSLPKRVQITEEGPREGFQIEPGPIAARDKARLIDALAATGLKHIETVSFVNPKRVPGMADAAEVVSLINPRPGVEYSALWFNERGLEQARATGKLHVEGKITLYGSEKFLARNLNRTPQEHLAQLERSIATCKRLGVPINRGSIASAFGCNFGGEVTLERVLSLADGILAIADRHELTIKVLTLADTMAWATPLAIKRVVGAVQDRFPQLAINLHLHDTRGLGIANAYAGLEMGVDQFDTAVAGLGGCPFAGHRGAAGNVCTEDLVLMCEEMGISTGVDLDALIRAALLAETIVGHPLPGSVMKGGSLKALRASARA